MKTVKSEFFDNFGQYGKWCSENGYEDYDNFIDEEGEMYKRYEQLTWYVQKSDGTYANFSGLRDYDEGLFDITLNKEGLTRTVEQVVVEKVKYV